MRRRLGALVLLPALVGCQSSGVTEPPRYDPRGTWNGTWRSLDGSASGTLSVEFYLAPEPGQAGGLQSVRLRASGAGCGPDGDIGDGSYSVELTTVSFHVRIRDTATSTTASGSSFQGQADGDRLAGSYTTGAFGHCQFCGCSLGDDGSWSATRAR